MKIMIHKRVPALFLIFTLVFSQISIVMANRPAPSTKFDFSHWKITLPTLNDAGNAAREIQIPEMMAGYQDEYFYLDDDDALVFWCPVDGSKTANTTYPRSELRELLDPNSTKVNWGWKGTHILNTSETVEKVPSTGKTIVSQIHGIMPNGDNANPLVKVQYDYNKKAVVSQLKTGTATNAADKNYYFYGVELGQRFDTQIKVVEGVLYVTISSIIDGTLKKETYMHEFVKEDSTWNDLLGYFKVGNYCQDNTVNEDYPQPEGAIVKVYSIDTFHDDNFVENIPIKNLSLETNEVTMQLGNTIELKPIFTPMDTTNRSVSWSVTDGADKIVVNKFGVVTAIGIGNATVKLTSIENPELSAQCNIEITEVKPPSDLIPLYQENFGTSAPKDIISDTNWKLSNKSETGTIDVEDDGTGNYVLKIVDNDSSNPIKSLVTFPQQNDTITTSFRIKVDNVDIKQQGTAKAASSIAYLAIGGGNMFSDSTEEAFRLRNYATLQGNTLADYRYQLTHAYLDCPLNYDNSKFELGQWKKITLVSTPDNGSSVANKTDVYIDDYKVAMQLDNNFAHSEFDQLTFYSGTMDTLSFCIDDVEVYAGAHPPKSPNNAPVESVKLKPTPATIEVGDSVQLSTTVKPDNALEDITYDVVKGNNIVAVSDKGLVTAISAGTATIRATSISDETKYDECSFTVVSVGNIVKVTGIELDKSNISIPVGENIQLNAVIKPDNATEKGIAFNVINGEDNVSVSTTGLVTALKMGTATIRVTSLDNSMYYTDCTIAVTMASSSEPQLLYHENFGINAPAVLNYSNATLPYWTLKTDANTELKIDNDGTGNYALKVFDSNLGGQPKALLKYQPQGSITTMEFRIKIDSDEIYAVNKVSAVSIPFGEGAITSTANETFKFKSYGKVINGLVTDRKYQYSNQNGNGFSDYPISPDSAKFDIEQWHTIKFITNPNDSSERANTTDIYIDGIKVGDRLLNKRTDLSIDSLLFQTGTQDLTKYWIDDVKIYSGEYLGQNENPDVEKNLQKCIDNAKIILDKKDATAQEIIKAMSDLADAM